MRHKIIRIILGAMLLVVGAFILIRSQLEWWNGALFLFVGAAFLLSAFKMNTKK